MTPVFGSFRDNRIKHDKNNDLNSLWIQGFKNLIFASFSIITQEAKSSRISIL